LSNNKRNSTPNPAPFGRDFLLRILITSGCIIGRQTCQTTTQSSIVAAIALLLTGFFVNAALQEARKLATVEE
jgi:hypothetical protein